MLEFHCDRIVAYRECGLSFYDVATRIGQNPMTILRISNQCVQEGHAKCYAGSQWHLTTNAETSELLLNRLAGSYNLDPETDFLQNHKYPQGQLRRCLKRHHCDFH
ncbi:hypothetical protein TNCV_2921191 [Trichonephila clavipes]|nr:hypothetical protein TNCV_2921191 [Trichonephila clavipes]